MVYSPMKLYIERTEASPSSFAVVPLLLRLLLLLDKERFGVQFHIIVIKKHNER